MLQHVGTHIHPRIRREARRSSAQLSLARNCRWDRLAPPCRHAACLPAGPFQKDATGKNACGFGKLSDRFERFYGESAAGQITQLQPLAGGGCPPASPPPRPPTPPCLPARPLPAGAMNTAQVSTAALHIAWHSAVP